MHKSGFHLEGKLAISMCPYYFMGLSYVYACFVCTDICTYRETLACFRPHRGQVRTNHRAHVEVPCLAGCRGKAHHRAPAGPAWTLCRGNRPTEMGTAEETGSPSHMTGNLVPRSHRSQECHLATQRKGSFHTHKSDAQKPHRWWGGVPRGLRTKEVSMQSPRVPEILTKGPRGRPLLRNLDY